MNELIEESNRLKKEELGSIWTEFLERHPALVARAVKAVRAYLKVHALSASKNDLLQMHRNGQGAEAERIALDKKIREAPYLTERQAAVDACFDALVELGADVILLRR